MALEDLELNVGGTSFKGVYIAILISFASTLGGGIWAASSFFSRLEAQESAVVSAVEIAKALETKFENLEEKQNESIQTFEVSVSNVKQSLEDNDIASLQGKLAELGTNLEAIMEAQKELLDLRDRIASVEKSNGEALLLIDNKLQSIDNVNDKLKRIQKEIEDLWEGIDSVANPLLN